jgi:hypothetical protein
MPRPRLNKHNNQSCPHNHNSNDKRGKGNGKNWLQTQTTPQQVHLHRPVVAPKPSRLFIRSWRVLCMESITNRERTGKRPLKGLVGGSLAWFMVVDCD